MFIFVVFRLGSDKLFYFFAGFLLFSLLPMDQSRDETPRWGVSVICFCVVF